MRNRDPDVPHGVHDPRLPSAHGSRGGGGSRAIRPRRAVPFARTGIRIRDGGRSPGGRMTPAALIFDFDGVILDSVEIKTEAMRRLFAAEGPEDLAEIIALHRRLGGISRYRKFGLIYADILRRPLDRKKSAELGRRFEVLVADGVKSCGEIRGARAVLESYAGRTPLFVVSGTPQQELLASAHGRGLDHYFAELHGSPPGKPEILG